MLKGRLGLEQARLPHADRHGLVYLERGALSVSDGCLRFVAAGTGDYRIPHQALSMVLLGPGSTISHDALRLLARHGTALSAVGEDGVRLYTAQPLLPDFSALARAQTRLWADAKGARIAIARRMYAWRLGEVLPHRDIAVLRGIEGAQVNRDRGASRDATPPTPPGIRVRTTAVRRIKLRRVSPLRAIPVPGSGRW
jgi:CRISP-associated protein Cas1